MMPVGPRMHIPPATLRSAPLQARGVQSTPQPAQAAQLQFLLEQGPRAQRASTPTRRHPLNADPLIHFAPAPAAQSPVAAEALLASDPAAPPNVPVPARPAWRQRVQAALVKVWRTLVPCALLSVVLASFVSTTRIALLGAGLAPHLAVALAAVGTVGLYALCRLLPYAALLFEFCVALFRGAVGCATTALTHSKDLWKRGKAAVAVFGIQARGWVGCQVRRLLGVGVVRGVGLGLLLAMLCVAGPALGARALRRWRAR